MSETYSCTDLSCVICGDIMTHGGQILTAFDPIKGDYDFDNYFADTYKYFQNADIALEKYVDMATAKKRNLYYADAPSVCDICKFPLSDAKFMVDGVVRGSLSWANMCGDCFCTYGVKIGWGYGQLYKREAGKWLLVGGFCPNPEQQP